MNKNILIAVLVLVVVVESGYILMKHSHPQMAPQTTMKPASGQPTPPMGKPMMVSKGAKLVGSPIEKYAFQVFPGPLSADAISATVGFSVKTTTLADGSTQVDLVPKDSDDQYQRYVVKKGETLYFIEMTKGDDNADSDRDMNYRDDYGIITDTNGVIQ